MANLQLGVLKPEYLQRAHQLTQSMTAHTQQGNQLAAMSRHPSAGSRSKEFNAQAQTHLKAAASNAKTLQTMVPMPAETLTRRANFDNQVSQYN